MGRGFCDGDSGTEDVLRVGVPPDRPEMNGSSTIVAIIGPGEGHAVVRASGLADAGLDVVVVPLTPWKGADPRIRVVDVRVSRGGASPFRLFKLPFYLLDLILRIRAVKADVYYVHFAGDIHAWMTWILGKRPFAVMVMGGDVLFDEQFDPSRWSRWLTQRTLREADLVTVKSNFLGDVVRRFGVDGERIHRVIWGVDTTRFRPQEPGEIRNELGLDGEGPVLLSPKIVRPFYNIDWIIEAVGQVRVDFPSVRLIILEHEPDLAYLNYLRDLVGKLGLESSVRFVPPVPNDRMVELYSVVDIVVGIPESDGLPTSLFEAMACGVPHVLADLDRYREVVEDGETAILVLPGVDSLAAGIRRILGDDELRRRISRAGRTRVQDVADFTEECRRVQKLLAGLVGTWRRSSIGARVLASAVVGVECMEFLVRRPAGRVRDIEIPGRAARTDPG